MRFAVTDLRSRLEATAIVKLKIPFSSAIIAPGIIQTKRFIEIVVCPMAFHSFLFSFFFIQQPKHFYTFALASLYLLLVCLWGTMYRATLFRSIETNQKTEVKFRHHSMNVIDAF